MIPVVLSIAGSDSGGGAGIQADLKTMHTLKVWGTTVLTCVTAQNLNGVIAIQPIESKIVAKQIQAVCEGFPVKVVKIGMLYSKEIIEVVSKMIDQFSISQIVLDPVMIATSGSLLLLPEAIESLQQELFPKATLITPNIHEASQLAGKKLEKLEDIKISIKALYNKYTTPILIKGGHLGNKEAIDIFYDGNNIHFFSGKYHDTPFTHGTGCTLSSAISSYLALGNSLLESIEKAKKFVEKSIENYVAFSKNSGALNVFNDWSFSD